MPQASVITSPTLFTNSPNYIGQLYLGDPEIHAFLQYISRNGVRFVKSMEFDINVDYVIGEGDIPVISENAAFTAPAPKTHTKEQFTNVTQIFQDSTKLSFAKMSAYPTLSGLNQVGGSPEAYNEWDFQWAAMMERLARSLNKTLIHGVFSDAGITDSTKANQTRGILDCIKTHIIDCNASKLTKDHINEAVLRIRKMFGNTSKHTMWVSPKVKLWITSVYAAANLTAVPRDRYTAGLNIETIVTAFGNLDVAVDDLIPNDKIVFTAGQDPSGRNILQPVFNAYDIPANQNGILTDGYMLIVPLPSAGGVHHSVYFQAGLDHSYEKFHVLLENFISPE